MGWASGSQLLSNVWGIVREDISVERREDMLVKLMGVFAAEDCDTLNEIICNRWPESEPAYEQWLNGKKKRKRS